MSNINNLHDELLTVVVPVYNSAQYLRKCVESLINQQYNNLDIILIDDGSTDESGEICNDYLLMDKRIRVFHEKNNGLVMSRKLGIKLAKGKLITFLDSDDWVESDMYLQMMTAYKEFEPDLLTSGIIIEKNDKISIEMDTIPKGIYECKAIKAKIMSCMMYDEQTGKRSITPSVWNKIYKVDLLKMTIMDLEKDITYGEDAAITYTYITRATKIMVLDKSWYHYVVHTDSMSRKFDISSFDKIFKFHEYMKKKFVEFAVWDVMEVQLKEYTKVFLFQSIYGVFDIIPTRSLYLFPFELIKANSSIVIYGAGKVGISYVDNILKSGYANLQGWVDENYERVINGKYVLETPDILKSREVDYVVIAIENGEVVLEIKENLKMLGIGENKIIWRKPVRLY